MKLMQSGKSAMGEYVYRLKNAILRYALSVRGGTPSVTQKFHNEFLREIGYVNFVYQRVRA